jgi:bifunctional DNA-binding transcriptional regulator/antitoxin component of YhaV-PrlF toxin-antitoxin module
VASVVVGEKGRLILPVAIRSEAGIDIGEELIVRVVGRGQIMLEARSVVLERLRSRFTGGGTEELREARALERDLIERRAAAAPAAHENGDLAAGAARAEEILAALDARAPSPGPARRRRRDAG